MQKTFIPNGVTVKSNCSLAFEDTTIYLKAKLGMVNVYFKDPSTGKRNTEPCLTLTTGGDYFSVDHDVYLFIAAYSGQYVANEHVIHEVRFIDSKHLHDSDEIDSEDDKKAFFGKKVDVVRKGAIKVDDEFTAEGYNRQLVRHNKIYSELVGNFISNSETMVAILHSLPHHEVATELAKEAEMINNRFSMLNDQFKNYQEDMTGYKEYINNLLTSRNEYRSTGDDKNPAYREQREIMDSINEMNAMMDKYVELMSKNHLIEEITNYDSNLKEYDQRLVDADKKVLSQIDSGSDEYLSKSEMKGLFSQ